MLEEEVGLQGRKQIFVRQNRLNWVWKIFIFTEPVHAWKPRFPVEWRLLIKDHIANVGIPVDVFSFLPFRRIFGHSGGWFVA